MSSKTLIGDYLGERDDFNLKVMHAYVDALQFEGLDFDAAIRCARPCAGWGGEAGAVDSGTGLDQKQSLGALVQAGIISGSVGRAGT